MNEQPRVSGPLGSFSSQVELPDDTPSLFKPLRLRRMIRETMEKCWIRDSNFETFARWYFKQHGPPESVFEPQSDEPLTPDNFPTHMINMALSMICQETPQIEVMTDMTNARKVKRGTKAEKVFMGVLWMNGEFQERDLLNLYALNLLTFGWGVSAVFWDDTRVPKSLKPQLRIEVERRLQIDGPASPDALRVEDQDTEDESERDFPIVVEVHHPGEIYPVDGGTRGRWKAIFRKMEAKLCDVEDHYGVSLPRTTDEWAAERLTEDETVIQVYDVWAWVGRQVWHTIFADGLPVWRMDEKGSWVQEGEDACFYIKEPAHMPEYDQLPYDIRFCIPTSDPNPEHYGLSLLYPVIDAVAAAERLASRQEMIIDAFADPIIKAKYDSTKSSSAVPPQVANHPGAIMAVDEGQGQDVELLQWSGSPPDVKSMIEMYRAQFKEYGVDVIVDGNTGIDSFVKQSGILAKLTVPVGQIEKGLAAIHTRICRLMTQVVKDRSLTIRGEITVDSESQAYVLTVKGTDMRGMEHAKVRIRARFPNEELQNAAVVQQLTAGDDPILSKYRGRSQYLNIQDPEAEADRIAKEKAENPNLYLPKLAELGLMFLEQKLQMELQQQMMVQQQEQPQTVPPVEGVMQQGLVQGATPDPMMDLVNLQGDPLMATGNAPGAPSPNTSIQQQQGQQSRGRPFGSGGGQ